MDALRPVASLLACSSTSPAAPRKISPFEKPSAMVKKVRAELQLEGQGTMVLTPADVGLLPLGVSNPTSGGGDRQCVSSMGVHRCRRAMTSFGTQNYIYRTMFGFYTTDGGHSFILSVVFLGAPSPVIWSANPDNPVTRNAILNFTSEGDLLLHEADGAIIWTTDTNSLSVAGMRLDDLGNLVLFDQNNTTVWQSLDHPTDTLVLGQSLCRGNNLSAKTSSTKWPGSRVYLSAELDGLQYSFKPAAYTQLFQATTTSTNATQTCYAFVNGSSGFPYKIFSIPLAGSVQLMRLESDGHLRVYEMGISYPDGFDVLSNFMNFCDYPLACGDFGVCSNGQCSCPSSNYFRLQNERHPDAGCIPLESISCDDMHDHKLIPLNNVSYFSYTTFQSLATRVSSEGFSITSIFVYAVIWKKCKKDEEPLFDGIPGIPKRFSFHELKAATSNFSMKLGAGGFGSVFKGTIGKETIAVKRLEGVNQGMEEFLAEVKTIGRIHQLNLVRLVGFCAEKSHRLLVYEYLSNGSLDNWIFHTSLVFTLSWKTRRNVMLAIARGLSYLHEECEEKIAHLHIKPQNILLDNKFNAKLSDFGLSKIINRDQSKVMTRMRGTRGYLAPEWLGSTITEKADIYSFGIVMIEKICGRQNLDESQPEQSIHLISLLQEKAKSGQLFDLVDSSSDDMKSNVEEIMQTMKLALWCLQVDSSRRPLMSTVAKVLEGAVSMEATPDCIFVPSFASINTDVAGSISSYVSSESQLSGPR
ncbi:unnamed protein product [Miscanthus lutarioriparius]|uniref:Receptor-like serine/threonine-protein kinase n=1 Tax=Miscanthus lutarioriparius TaxID=422564 RepID=A0A811QIS4_9POAL|nr:unnamed protein product [Miscanthus lutarioriparius]